MFCNFADEMVALMPRHEPQALKGNEVRILDSTRCCNSRFLTMCAVVVKQKFVATCHWLFCREGAIKPG